MRGVEGGLTKGRLAVFFAALAGSAVLGIVAGLIWAVVAPRPLLQEVAHGEAQYVNVETTAFIVADAWFALIAAVGGLITGAVGYRILVRRGGAAATAGLVLGAVAAAFLAWWVGDNIGLGAYNHLLATSPGVKNVLLLFSLKIKSYSIPALQFGAKPYSQPTPTVPAHRVRSAEANPTPVKVLNKSQRWSATAAPPFT